MSSVAPEATLTEAVEPRAPPEELSKRSVPALTVVAPLKVFAPPKVRNPAPLPALVRPRPKPEMMLLTRMPPLPSTTMTLSVALPRTISSTAVSPLESVKSCELLFRNMTFCVPLTVAPLRASVPDVLDALFTTLSAAERADVTSMAPTLCVPPLLPMSMPTGVVPDAGLAPNWAMSPEAGTVPPVQLVAASQALPAELDQRTDDAARATSCNTTAPEPAVSQVNCRKATELKLPLPESDSVIGTKTALLLRPEAAPW